VHDPTPQRRLSSTLVCTVLKTVEEAKERAKGQAETAKMVEAAAAKHGLSRQSRDSNKDVISHFILRLAYCRT